MSINSRDSNRLLLYIRAMKCGLWEYDIDADVLDCDERWYEIFGVDQISDPARCIEDLKKHIVPEDVDVATRIDKAELSRIMDSDDRYHVDFRVLRSDGQVRWLRSVASLVLDSVTNHLCALGCVTDITEFFSAPHDDATPEIRSAASWGGAAHPLLDGSTLMLTGGERPLLSERERECLIWVSMGKTAWETAAIIGRSRRTVEFHLKNAIVKLRASNKVHAVAISIRNGLL